MSYPFEYRQNYISDKCKYNLELLKKCISFNHGLAKEVIEALLKEMEQDSWDNFETN